jgi:DNA-binding transcriptional MerR regulator
MPARYHIGEFAALGGVSVKTLRFYDEIGLLRPAAIDPRTRYRHYLPQQLEELASILALKTLGVSLSEIGRLKRKGGSKQDRKDVLNELKRSLEHSLVASNRSLRWIDSALRELEFSDRPVQVVVKRRPAYTVASVRAKVRDYSEIARCERDLLLALPAEVCGDLRGVLWHRCADSGCLEGEPFVALRRPLLGRSIYDVKELPAITAASAYTALDDESAEQAYHSIRRWMTAGGYHLAGPKREIYLDNLLEIQFPLAPA